ncbi:LacI family transcriptional regulator [Arachidicoccus ginsenosidimutans]|uniref:LacI family DNA-binding transcriptional regulator n=1 Tax=Arachidicoccus sp. BS20 TaxID=1850526 RepID=UPI0007F0F168|nr:LacI family DNA-binding transcriptional regulator [Arachidicoccus sp. BS20]ANI88790.1 LacI family transcriptional regulator [Arachidicoccus sp. BS20]
MHKEITIYDIAQNLNISASTVSRGLNNNPLISKEIRDKIHHTAKELGYRHNTIASNLRRQQSKTIGLLLHELNSNFVTSVLAGIEKIATKEGYDLLIAHSGEDGQREIANAKNLLSKRVDGIIASMSLGAKGTEHFNPFFERKIPVVFFDRVPRNIDCVKVVIDNYKNGYEATAHLIQNGYKNIAHITADLSRNVYNDRFNGYKQALTDNGIIFKKKLMKICSRSEKDIIKVINQLLKHKPDAFFITNDFAAAVCIEELREKGFHVPNDIGVFGFNNDTLGNLISPKLSTINYPGIKMGESAAKELFSLLKSKGKTGHSKTIVIPSRLIIRESSVRDKV